VGCCHDCCFVCRAIRFVQRKYNGGTINCTTHTQHHRGEAETNPSFLISFRDPVMKEIKKLELVSQPFSLCRSWRRWVGWSRCMRLGFVVRCISGGRRVRGLSFFRGFRGGIRLCIVFCVSSVVCRGVSGFGVVSLVRFRSLAPVLGCISCIRSRVLPRRIFNHASTSSLPILRRLILPPFPFFI
jgi:hypothetical protein